jgi:type IV pilus assembly protein PilV
MGQHVSSNNHAGFTLIEFCVAVLIMMVGLLGLLQAVNMATVHNLGNLLRNEAITLADDRMVRAKASVNDAQKFEDLVSDTISAANLVSRGVRSGFANYSVVLTVVTAGNNTKELASRVVWRYKGNKQTHTISSIVAKPNQ